MGKSAVAFCPGKITGYFLPVYDDDPANTGSLGACVIIDRGVTATVRRSGKTSIKISDRISGRCMYGSRPLEEACILLGVTAEIETESGLPLHSGYGLSAAALLSVISALNGLYDLGMDRHQVAGVAHRIEVEGMTGLGDVASLAGGGLVCRKGPGVGAEISRFFPDTEIYSITLGELKTEDILSGEGLAEDLGRVYPGRCPKGWDDFVTLSRSFAEDSGLISSNVRRVLEMCDTCNVPASMMMLGEGVFAAGNRAHEILSRFGRVNCFHVHDKGFGDAEVTG